MTELRRDEADKLLKSNPVLLVLVLVLILVRELRHNTLHKLTIQFELLHHRGHIVWRGWRIVGTTTTTTRWSNHPAGIQQGVVQHAYNFNNFKTSTNQRDI